MFPEISRENNTLPFAPLGGGIQQGRYITDLFQEGCVSSPTVRTLAAMSLSGGSPRGEDGLHGEWAARDAAPWAVLRYVTRMSRKICER
ncbi:hypothetical protein AGIG_G17304 [Arapaima gigas]